MNTDINIMSTSPDNLAMQVELTRNCHDRIVYNLKTYICLQLTRLHSRGTVEALIICRRSASQAGLLIFRVSNVENGKITKKNMKRRAAALVNRGKRYGQANKAELHMRCLLHWLFVSHLQLTCCRFTSPSHSMDNGRSYTLWKILNVGFRRTIVMPWPPWTSAL